MSYDRRSVLAAALAVPAATTLLTATPAAAAPGTVDAQPWTDLLLEPGVTAQANAKPQIRLITIAGTTFLQARGAITCDLTADTRIATMPGVLKPTSVTRAVAPRNNSQGINSCRLEISTTGAVTVYGGNTGNPVTWVQLDSVQTIWR
ncbi:hypothetical protein [Streptomyces sp. NPDC051567]|uniref:hypothetical protein n=1 Tax=Streptomyces sp. NPDC051567 TaxID=3365660 RepID=UPI0037A2D723